MSLLKEIILSGSPYERGFQHGHQLGSTIREFLNDHRARIHLVRNEPIPDSLIDQLVQQHATVIEHELPVIAEELRGLAEGASISWQDAVLLQMRMELISYRQLDHLEGDCSTIAFRLPAPGGIITGQTIDLPGDLTGLTSIFRILPQYPHEPSILLFGFAGLLGYMGMNSFGLSVNINMVLSDDWQPGIPPYLLVRHLLSLRNIDECLRELKQLRRASSRSFIIADKHQLVNVEMTGKKMVIIEDDCLLHTNHFLHQSLQSDDSMHFLFRNSSVKRLERLQQLLPEKPRHITQAEIFEWLSDHSLYPVGICAHGEGNIRRSETVGAVVMEPAGFTMYARRGYPCCCQTQTFTLDKHIELPLLPISENL